MKRKRILDISLGATCALAAVGAAPTLLEAATELARVNATVISLEDFNRKYRENLKFFQFNPPKKRDLLDDLIKRELGIQEAKRQGLDKDPEIVERMNTVLYHALIDRKLSKQFEEIHISDDEAKSWYVKNPEIRASHVLVMLRPDATPEQEKAARKEIERIRDEHIKPGKMSFAEIAQRYSQAADAPMGGDTDYRSRDRLDPIFYNAAVALKKPGNVSDIVRTQFGFHIIKLTAVRPWEEVDKPHVKRMLFDERKGQIFERYMGQLRQSAKVAVKAELLKD